jgi:hypothetical protein
MPMLIAGGAMLLFSRPSRSLWSGRGRWTGYRPASTMRKVYVSFLLSLLVSSLYLGGMRYRIKLADRGSFYTDESNLVPAGHPFFPGFTGSRRFPSVLEQVGRVVQANPGRKLYFGPRMNFCYAVFKVDPPRALLPMWWFPGSSFERAKEGEILKRWQAEQFDVVVFLGRDATYYSPQFLKLIVSNYAGDTQFSELSVFYRKH